MSLSSGNNVTVLFLCSFLLITSLSQHSFCNGGCTKGERDALLKLKHEFNVSSNRLADWVGDGDCCRWTGVVCHNITAHVLELHLRTQSIEEYFGADQLNPYYDEYDKYIEYENYYVKSAISGKVSSSLLQLKHLRYLDLSYNDFRGVSIPNFLGFMVSLRYLNLSNAGFGGIIPPQLGNLSNLKYLNLQGSYSYNLEVDNLDWVSSLSSLEFFGLSYVDLSQFFDWLKVMSSLPSLVQLHLSSCRLFNFNRLPNLNFSSLSSLDLSNNLFQGPILNGLQNMTSFLGELVIRSNLFNSSIPNWLYGLSNLEILDLSSNDLQGQISSAIGNLTSLVSLDLSSNYELEFDQGIPMSFKNLCNLRSFNIKYIKLNQEINNFLEILASGCVSNGLESLVLYDDLLSGHLTDGLGHLKNLKSLYLYSNFMIHGPIPRSVKHLCNLKSLSLNGVKLNQEINDVLEILATCASNGLQVLQLTSCQLSGHLTNHLSHFNNLKVLALYDNSISGPIPKSLGEMASLQRILLSFNKLNGTLPISLGNLTELVQVHIMENLLHGEVSELHFVNLTKLILFQASRMGKSIVLRVSPNWIPPLQLQYLELGSWHIGPQFPMWLRLLEHLKNLDLSNSGISSTIPLWFWNVNSEYRYLNFSQNQLHGLIPNIPSFGDFNSVIDLNSNNFSGPLPYFSLYLTALDLSNNSFSGSILNFLCYKMDEVKVMRFLFLQGNNLSNEIPDCWGSWRNLIAIRLSNNKFSGNIPNSIGTLSLLESLRFRNNNLTGVIPLSLANCTSLFTLDLGRNELAGNIPTWIGDRYPGLNILSLRENKFDGLLPKELCRLVSLRILDLADNAFSGTIPSCFNNFTTMATRNDSTGWYYLDKNVASSTVVENILLVMKGKEMEYSTILRFLRSIDLSNNNLSGEIPKEIMSLAGLQSLNLSQNALTGRIPNEIGDMRWLESMDFSQNQFSGEIPGSISSLTFLSSLNLSYNELSGRIPSGTQIQGFDRSSFMGNQLCGPPLTNNCIVDDTQPDIDHGKGNDENEAEIDVWFYGSIAFGFVVGFWSALGSLIFIRRWRHFYFRWVNNMGEKIWLSFWLKFN